MNGDGRREVLAAREAASGNASLVALAADGSIRWQTEFVGFDGSMPIWNFSGLSYWSVGYFRSNENMDVFATLRRGKLGSEVGFLLDGRSGKIVWESRGFILPENGSGRSLGGHPSAAGDVDGDGLEEIVVMWPDRLHIVDGGHGHGAGWCVRLMATDSIRCLRATPLSAMRFRRWSICLATADRNFSGDTAAI